MADQLGLKPAEILYVGDSSVDAEASQAAGMPFAAYRNPDLRARVHIRDLSQVRGLVSPGA